MDTTIQNRLDERGIDLVPPSPPRHAYVAFTRDGDTLYFSGKTAIAGGEVHFPGRLESAADMDRGRESARLCAVNMLAAVEQAIGLENVGSILKLTGFVASGQDFWQQPEVINAASDLFIDILGEAGAHARSAIGVAALPGNSAVEIEIVVRHVAGTAR